MGAITITDDEIALLRMLPQSYLNEENGASRIVANDYAFLIAETIVFALYLISRYKHDGGRGIETRLLLPVAYLCNLGLLIGGPLAVNYGGAGYHIYALILRDKNIVKRYLQIQSATEVFYLVAITCSKLAMLVLYLRVFTNRIVRYLTMATVGLVVANFLAGILMSFLICRPYAVKWNFELEGTCGDIMATFRWVSLPNIVSDIAILLLPASTLYRLHVGRTQKITLAITFLIGSLGIVAAAIRFVTFFEIDMVADPTFLCTKTAITTDAEAGAYFLCACFPGLRPLISRVQKKLRERARARKAEASLSAAKLKGPASTIGEQQHPRKDSAFAGASAV